MSTVERTLEQGEADALAEAEARLKKHADNYGYVLRVLGNGRYSLDDTRFAEEQVFEGTYDDCWSLISMSS
jgi:hypothetical protein